MFADPESFVRRGPTSNTCFCLFLVYDGREGPNANISGPSSARQRNAFKWRLIGVSKVAQH